jgi:hypothetical protein
VSVPEPDTARAALTIRKCGRNGWTVELVRRGVSFYDGEEHATISVAPVSHRDGRSQAPYCFHEAVALARLIVDGGYDPLRPLAQMVAFRRPRQMVIRTEGQYPDMTMLVIRCAACYRLVTGYAC